MSGASLDNAALADALEAFAALLELAGAGPYSARAYRRAGELIRTTPVPVAELVRAGRVRELRGIGAAIEARLRELVETGRIAELEELERSVAPQLVAVGRLAGVGASRMVAIGDALGIRTVEELRAAAADGRLRDAPGVGPETERRLARALERAGEARPRRGLLLNRAWRLSEAVADALGGEVAGDARRWRDTCERLAVACAAREAAPVLDALERHPQIVSLLERRPDGGVGVTVEGVPVEVVVAPPERYGTALLRATGSEEYVASLEPLPDAPDEAGVFRALGLPYLPPELREAGAPAAPPAELVEVADVRGDLHCHTTWSDGKTSVLELGRAARDLGYAYVAVCDHTEAVRVVPGVDADALRRQGEEIAAANEELAPFQILRGVECDVLPDGSLDLPDDVLAELDWVQISVHAGQRARREEITRRVVEAMRHPAASCLSHPKGRILNHRPENALDLDEVFAVALETGVALEVNGLPDRLDLAGEHVRRAVAAGVALVCSTDAHSIRGLGNMRLAVATARRGGATRADVLNTLPLDRLLAARRSK
ncbi:MAG TPA: helix-hairpin-helix domain-containing protein [Gaiellaceae bacterium]|nr:helix-hairpin-helix domain-containing protein [Gaiellaceae bacterium]